jgi:hypothetical protein
LPVMSHTRAMAQLQNSEKARFYTIFAVSPTRAWLLPHGKSTT